MTARGIRVVVCDDQPAMRAAFRTILEAADVEVVGEAGDGDEVIDVVRAATPDVVLMDIRMPGRDGISATAALVAERPAARVLVLTTFDGDAELFGALESGASGFVLKNAGPEVIVDAVVRVAGGDAVLDPSVVRRVVQRFAAPAATSGDAASTALVEPLTERERDVLWLVAQGMTNGEVASTLGVGEETAKTHVSRILSKLGVRDRVQAVIAAHQSGFAATARPI